MGQHEREAEKVGDKSVKGRDIPDMAGSRDGDELINELRGRVAFLEQELRTRKDGHGAGAEKSGGPSHERGWDEPAMSAAHRSLTEKSRYLDAFFDNTITPLVLLDRDFNFIRVNKAYARACQKGVDEYPGYNHFEFYPSDARAIFEDVIRTRQPVLVAARPFVFPDHPEWGVTYWNWTLTPLLDDRGEVEALIFSLEDVTALKRAEIELEGHRDRLRRLVGERTRDLEAANDRLRNEISERQRTEDELRDSEERLAADLAAMTGLQKVSMGFVQKGDLGSLLDDIIAAAVAVAGTDKGTLQLIGPGSEELDIVAQRGFERSYTDFFASVSHGAAAACAAAFGHGERVIVEDVTKDPIFNGTPALDVQLEAGVRAVQSTPIVDRRGRTIGMLSTHWGRPFRPDERVLRYIDLLARQAADVLERKWAEEALRESETRYRTLFDSIDEGFCIIEVLFDAACKPVDYRFLEVNPAFERQTGLHQAQGKTMRSLAPDHEEHWFETYGRVALTGRPERFVNAARALNRWYDVYAFSVGGAESRKVAILFNDITEHKRAEEALLESEERLRLAQEVARIGTFEWNIQTGVNKWTSELEAMYGLPRGGFPGTQPAWEQLVYHEDRARAVGAVSEAIEKGGFEGEWRVVWPDGSVHWLYGRGFVFKDDAGKPLKLIGVNMDITERRRAEEAMRESEARFRAIFEQAAVGMAQVSLDGRFMRVNRKFCDITGYPYHEVIRLGPKDITHPDDLPKEQRQIDRLLAGEISTFTSEKRYVRKDGTLIWINLTVALIYKDGMPAYFSGVTEDITRRKRAEEALREGEASLARAQAIARLASWEVDVRTNRVQGSGELYRMFDLKPDISLDAYIAKFHPDDRATVVESINAAIYQGKRYSTDYRIVPRPGDIRHVHADGEVIYDENGLPVKFFGTVQDITDRKQIEEEMKVAKLQAELYLDLMGHDINNMHQIALGYLELARAMPAGDRQAEMIEKPIEVLQRSAQLIKNVRKLQNFSDGVFQEQDVDICRVLSQVHREFGAVPLKAVALDLNGIDHCHVRANELLNDVFVNLVSNAIKHTGDRADVVISMDIVDEGGRYCRIKVEDDGPGIPDGFKDKIFNRLLKSTSKAKGMGLGLYLVKSLVDSYGGKVWAEDRVPGDHARGARFVVMLPVIEQ